jgi:hypothetical protein
MVDLLIFTISTIFNFANLSRLRTDDAVAAHVMKIGERTDYSRRIIALRQSSEIIDQKVVTGDTQTNFNRCFIFVPAADAAYRTYNADEIICYDLQTAF